MQKKYYAMFAGLTFGLIIAILSVPVSGHGIFKKTLEKKYKSEGLRVTCTMCHVDGEEKDHRNELGELFLKEFEGKEFTKKWYEVEEDEDALEKFEKEVMGPAFLEALEKIYAREAAGEVDTKFSEQIPKGEVEGTKLKKKRRR